MYFVPSRLSPIPLAGGGGRRDGKCVPLFGRGKEKEKEKEKEVGKAHSHFHFIPFHCCCCCCSLFEREPFIHSIRYGCNCAVFVS